MPNSTVPPKCLQCSCHVALFFNIRHLTATRLAATLTTAVIINKRRRLSVIPAELTGAVVRDQAGAGGQHSEYRDHQNCHDRQSDQGVNRTAP